MNNKIRIHKDYTHFGAYIEETIYTAKQDIVGIKKRFYGNIPHKIDRMDTIHFTVRNGIHIDFEY